MYIVFHFSQVSTVYPVMGITACWFTVIVTCLPT
jgi:hypothetical protein